MDKREIIEKLKKYTILLNQHFHVDKVVLFGSYAKGTQHQDSDIDVAVIVNSFDGDYLSFIPLLWKIRREVDDRIEPKLFIRNDDSSGFSIRIPFGH